MRQGGRDCLRPLREGGSQGLSRREGGREGLFQGGS